MKQITKVLLESPTGVTLNRIIFNPTGTNGYSKYTVVHNDITDIFGDRASAEIRYNDVIDYMRLEYDRLLLLPYDKFNEKEIKVINRLQNLIKFRLDLITSVTVNDYNVVKEMIQIAYLYNLGESFIKEIRNKFKHFKYENGN